MASWFQRIVQGYQPVANNQASLMPGYFESEEPIDASSRNSFNSKKVKKYINKSWEVLQLVILKPLIFVLFCVFTIISKVLNVIYFKEHYYDSVLDPTNKASKFIRDLEDNLLVRGKLPPFFLGSYTQALYMATNKGKFLFVYLTNPENENSASVFNKVIINDKFVSIFNDPNFIIWGGDLTNPESYQLANSLNVSKFPFLGLLCLTRSTTMSPEGPRKGVPKISLLVKIQGGINDDVNADRLIEQKFVKKIEKYGPELKLIRNELWEKFIDQVFRTQQDLNYQKSLAKDKLKKQRRQQELLEKEYFILKLQHFKDLDTLGDTARVAIKLSSGERITQLFPAQSKVSDIFDFVELHRRDYFNKTFDTTVDPATLEGFQPDYKFRLIAPLPPKVTLENLDETVRNVDSIYPNGLLAVEEF